ncbi:MAG: tetratricopeptide repeat protein, partial [Methanococcaceae archaeon]
RRGYIYKTLGHLSEAQGKVNEKQAHFAEAARMFEHLLLSDPTNASVQNGWGNIQYILGNLDAAIAAYNRAIELYPQYTAAFHDLALAYEQKMEVDRAHAKGWCQEALKAWKKAYELAPEDPGFTPYNILTIGQRINRLERECSSLM